MKYLLILCIGFCLTAFGQKNGLNDAADILQKVKERFDAVNDYTALLTAKVDMERLKIPEMKVKIYFKQPNKVHVESKNFAMLPREGFAMNPSDLLEKFDATLMEKTERGGVPFYKLRLISRPEKNRPPRESFIWVDGSRWVITGLESTPAEGRTIKVQFEYTTIDGK